MPTLFSGTMSSGHQSRSPGDYSFEFGDDAFETTGLEVKIPTNLVHISSAMGFAKQQPNVDRLLGNMALSPPGLRRGTSSYRKIKINNTVIFVIDGVFKSRARVEVSFSSNIHDISVMKEAQFVVSLQADSDVTITKGSEASVGESVMPDAPAGEIPIGAVKIACSSRRFDAGTTSLADSTLTVAYTDYAFLPGSDNADVIWSDGVVADGAVTFTRKSSGISGLAFCYILIGQ